MRYGSYRFTSVLSSEALLPEYKGSTFRGAFGHALKRVVCALRREDCTACLLREKCVYAFVFETAVSPADVPPAPPSDGTPPDGAVKTRIAAPPHPYVIEPPETTRTAYHPGDAFDFNLLLFGPANDYLPYFVYAFEQMGRLGIGRAINGIRGAFNLVDVTSDGKCVYDARNGKIRSGDFAHDLFLDENTCSARSSALEVTLHTPLRLKYENHFEATLPFHVLVRAALRRISSLCHYFGSGEPPLDYRGLVARAQAITTESSSIRWVDWKRYSNRQDQSMLMGGMTGKSVYRGDLGEFLPLIRFCEKVHLGKQTSFGLGRISMTTHADSISMAVGGVGDGGSSSPPETFCERGRE